MILDGGMTEMLRDALSRLEYVMGAIWQDSVNRVHEQENIKLRNKKLT
jgi:hypothetical protein